MEFSLSEEQKRKIEQEEGARIAEERYREQVRRSMRSPVPAVPLQAAPKNKQHAGFIALIATAAVVLGVFFFGFSRTGPSYAPGSSSSPLSRWVPVTVSLVQGQFQVPAQNYRSWAVEVPDNVRGYHVAGHYSAIGGGGNDIQAVIATEDEFQNWINGHQAHVFYGTPDRVTTGTIDVLLPPGRYVLAFSNRFSMFTPKAVFAEISANYEIEK